MEYNVRTTELKSNKLLIARIVSHCVVRMKTGMRFTMTVAKLITVLILFINIAESDGLHTEEPVCQRFTADNKLKNLINQRRHNTVPCPCDVQKIELDHTFRKSNKCYEQWFFIEGAKQMCCYNENGHLLVGPPDGGFILLEEHEPYISAANHQCCLSSSRLCQVFYAINPSDNCSMYEPPISVKSGGDVHITTIDGLTYDFNGHGEYVFLKADEFEIQARTDYVIPGNIQSTMFTAFAFYDGKNNEQIEVHLNRSNDVITVFRNRTLICNTTGIRAPCGIPTRNGCNILVGSGIVIIQRCSIGSYFNQIKITSGEFMDISFELGKSYLQSSSGLAGNASYGFVLRNNLILPNSSAELDLFEFGESWALLNESESLFEYSISGQSYSFYNGNHTTPIFLESLLGNLTELFKGWSNDNITLFNATCRTSWDNKQNDRCLLTIARTGELALGKVIIDGIEEDHRRWHILQNKRPEFLSSMPDNITVQNNRLFTLYLPTFVTDIDNDALSFNVTTSIQKDEINLTADGNFTWMVGTALRYIDTKLVFYVIDSFNATNSHEVKITYCGCEDIEQCNYNAHSENSSESVVKAICNCPKYHSGDYCEIIVDPCNSTELNVTCVISCNSSFPKTLESWPCTPCLKGTTDHIRGGKQECLDIDECDISYKGDDKCDHNCNNTYGSFNCHCRKGYTLNANNHTCDDINECLNETLCQTNEVCKNFPGGYSCECAPSYTRIGQNNCTKIEGSIFVGSIQFPIINSLTIDQSRFINSVENRNKFEKTLIKMFNASGRCLGVDVVELSITGKNAHKRSTNENLHLNVVYIVHWSGNETTGQIDAALRRSISTPSNTTNPDSNVQLFDGIEIQTQAPEIIEHKDGLCSIANATDCDPESTQCENLPPFGGHRCKCSSGFTNLTGSSRVCQDEDECIIFQKNGTQDQRCANGYCTNTVGSWNCSCPPGRQWQSVGNSTYPLYRCQGNFSYLGRLELEWRGNTTQQEQIQTIQEVLTQAFQNSSVVDTIQNVFLKLKELLVSVNILELKGGVTGPVGKYSNTTATFNLRMGENVNISGIIKVLNTSFGTSWISSNSSWLIKDVHIFNDFENKLCEFTANGNCDLKTTSCKQTGTSVFCMCRQGYEKRNDNDKFCYDIDECNIWTNANRTFCSGKGTCSNEDGGYTCLCEEGYQVSNTNSADISCNDMDECKSVGYVCGDGTCNNTVGSWSCLCNSSGYIQTNPSKNIFWCKDIDECTNSSYQCGGTCKNSIGTWNCTCPSGYHTHNASDYNITCEEINECEQFQNNHTKESMCIRGTCINLPGSWNCTCPVDRQWTPFSNGSYRCQGNFTYFGFINFLTLTVQEETIKQLTNTYVKELYQNTTRYEDKTMALRDLLVSVNIRKVTVELSAAKNLHNFTVMFSLQMGEAVSIDNLQSVLDEAYNKSVVFGRNSSTITISSNMYYKESNNILCNLTNFGGCNLDSTVCTQRNGTTHCQCRDGFQEHPGESKFCDDIDECKSNDTCSGQGHCSNEIGSYTCKCYDGYYLNTSDKHSIVCEDIDECEENKATCSGHGQCHNLPGHYNCSCQRGFNVKYTDGKDPVCEDIDECKSNGTCSGRGHCSNDIGNYTCECYDGYYLNTSDKHDCEDIDECLGKEANCSGHGVCHNIPGHYNCSCNDGFKVKYTNGKDPVCEDIDECLYSSLCPVNMVCHNQPGNYTCQCHSGYKKNNSTFCADVDECLATHQCINSNCTNTQGSYECKCYEGYKRLNDTFCEDIDECSNGTLCTDNNKCVNYPGGYNCTCRDGYTRSENTTECQDIDECNKTTSIFCYSHGKCKNLDGGYTCLCDEGYIVNSTDINNITCEDVDECHNTSYFCGGKCKNADGSWTCECEAGYAMSQKTKNNILCTDIDECTKNSKACISGFCQNTNGSWNCSCREGAVVKVINETTKECSGGYQYVVTLEFAAAVSSTQNMDENNPKLKNYFKNLITEAYRKSFPDSGVKVDILSIKHSQRPKRETSTGLSNWEVDFVLNVDTSTEKKVVESALTNYTEKCQSNCQVHGEPPPFNILLGKVELKTDPASVLCDRYNYCDKETTNCEYMNDTTKCTCKKGYLPKENTDAKCQVIPGVCTTSVCENGATCLEPENPGRFKCICAKGWTGEYCSIAQSLVSDSDQTNTMLIAVGGSLGGIVIILLVTIFVVCRWRGRKVKEAEKIALKNMDNNGSKHFNGSLYDDRYIGDSQHNSLERKSLNSFREPRQNESPVQSGYRISSANLYATPHKLHRQTIHGSMIDLPNGHVDHFRDEPRRLSIQDPQRHIASNMGWSYTANMTRPVSLNGDILRKHPHADYDRPPSPQPDYHRNERFDAARDSGMGVGHNRHGSFSNDYRHSDPLRRIPFDGPNGETRF